MAHIKFPGGPDLGAQQMETQEAAMNELGSREPSQFQGEWLERAIRIRDKRIALFGADICMDPSWDILLFLARDENANGATFHQIATAVRFSPETVCRWLRVLIDRNHVDKVSAEIFKLSDASRNGLPAIFE